MDKTQPLPTFRSLFAATQPEPRRRYPKTTASVAVTQRMKVERVVARSAET